MTDPRFTELLAHLRRGGGQACYFTLPDALHHWDADGPPSSRDADVFFSVYTYADKSRKVEQLHAVNAFVADFDAKDLGDLETTLEAAKLHGPSAIICSGGGYHAYWLLDEPFICEDAGDRDRISLALKAWVRFVGADPAAALPTQVLRVPGTLNHKYDPPRLVDMVMWTPGRLYTLEGLETRAQPLAVIEPPVRPREDRPEGAGTSVIERFNLTHTLGEVICPHGYVTTPDGRYFRRPGKSGRGVSGYYRDDRVYSFSSSDPLSNGHQVDAFDAFRILDHGGDMRAAVRAAAQKLGMTLARPERLKLQRTANANGGQGNGPVETEGAQLPRIQLGNQQLRDQTQAAIDALVASNQQPSLFVRDGQVVDIVRDERGTPSIRILDEAQMRGRLTLVADFVYVKAEGDGVQLTNGHPPRGVVGDVLARGEWPFPPLVGVIQTPSIRPDGSLITMEGYDSATCLYYEPSKEMGVIHIVENPTPEQVASALKLVAEIVADFPFADAPSRANTLALLMTPVIRPLIDGLVPLAIIDAPKAGTGKSLLAQALSTLATGDPSPGILTPTKDEGEMRKRITSTLLSGENIIVFDNLDFQLRSSVLSAALTSNTWKDRRLGASEIVELPQRATWIVTGNNVRLGSDIPRRAYWIKLDAKSSRPFMRTNFEHPELLAWVIESRPALIASVLTIARAWVNAGRPMSKKRPMGSFQSWADILGGILDYAGVNGFLGNAEELLDEVDEEGSQWEGFIFEVATRTSGQPMTVDELCKMVANDDQLRQFLPDSLAQDKRHYSDGNVLDDEDLRKKLSYELRKRKETRYGAFQARIEAVPGPKNSHKPKQWRFKVESCPSESMDALDHGPIPAHPGGTLTHDAMTEESIQDRLNESPASPHPPVASTVTHAPDFF